MGIRTVVSITDDHDGKELDGFTEKDSIKVSVGSLVWNVYLSDANADKLADMIADFVPDAGPNAQAAPAQGGTRRRKRRSPEEIAQAEEEKAARMDQRRRMQKWVKANLPDANVPDRGRIARDVADAFYADNSSETRYF